MGGSIYSFRVSIFSLEGSMLFIAEGKVWLFIAEGKVGLLIYFFECSGVYPIWFSGLEASLPSICYVF